jgi:hypothetical protein
MFNSRAVAFQPDRLLKSSRFAITIVVSALLNGKTFGIAAPEGGCAENSARYGTISPAVSETVQGDTMLLKSKTAPALPATAELADQFAHGWDTRVSERLTIAGHRGSFGFP